MDIDNGQKCLFYDLKTSFIFELLPDKDEVTEIKNANKDA